MKIFISWSGVRSKHIAEALRDWLPNVIQSLKPFISTRDIAKGKRGIPALTKELEQTNIGIICLTPENLKEPWLLFEAGALSKLPSAHVCTYIYGMEASDVELPLGDFQYTKADKTETSALLHTINGELGEMSILPQRLTDAVERWWPVFQDALDKVPPVPPSEPVPPTRTQESKLDEILNALRGLTPLASSPRGPIQMVSKNVLECLEYIQKNGDLPAGLPYTSRSALMAGNYIGYSDGKFVVLAKGIHLMALPATDAPDGVITLKTFGG